MKRILVVTVLLALLIVSVGAQTPTDVENFQEKMSRHLETKFPGWKHKRDEPIQGSKNVVIQRWTFSNRVVSISIVPHKSADEAREAIQNFVRADPAREALAGMGDEAYAWGYGLSEVVFRRGKMNIYISTYADVESDADASSLSSRQKGERAQSEMKRLSREFAKHVATAADEP